MADGGSALIQNGIAMGIRGTNKNRTVTDFRPVRDGSIADSVRSKGDSPAGLSRAFFSLWSAARQWSLLLTLTCFPGICDGEAGC
jgi:hypothetical protein